MIFFDAKQFSDERMACRTHGKDSHKICNRTIRECQKRQNKRYGRISNVRRQIGYDIKQGATNEQVLLLLQKIRNDSSFSSLRKNNGSIERINEVEKHFMPKEKRYSWD